LLINNIKSIKSMLINKNILRLQSLLYSSVKHLSI